jgi:hypothetical protein
MRILMSVLVLYKFSFMAMIVSIHERVALQGRDYNVPSKIAKIKLLLELFLFVIKKIPKYLLQKILNMNA